MSDKDYDDYREKMVKKRGKWIEWGDSLPCKLPALFRIPTISTEVFNKKSKERASKLLFVLYAAVMEEIMRVVVNEGKPDHRRIQLLGESAHSARTAFSLLLLNDDVGATTETRRRASELAESLFDLPLGELARRIWSGRSGTSAEQNRWFDVIRRKDETMMAKQLQLESRAGSMLTTPLGLAMRMGSFHCVSSLVHICDPTKPVSFVYIELDWKNDFDPPPANSNKIRRKMKSLRDKHNHQKGAVEHGQTNGSAENNKKVSIITHLLNRDGNSGSRTPEDIFLSKSLQYGVSAQDLAIVSYFRAQTDENRDLWQRVLGVFRKDPNVQAHNTSRACYRVLSFAGGFPELIVVLALFALLSYTYSALWNGVGTLQFSEHIVAKFTEEPFNGDHFTFQDIGTEGEFWDWLTSPGFLGEIYPDGVGDNSDISINDNEAAAKKDQPGLGRRRLKKTGEFKKYDPFQSASFDAGANLLVGPVRIRQLRVRSGECTNSVKSKGVDFGSCLRDNLEDTDNSRWSHESFGSASNPTRYRWKGPEDEEISPYERCGWVCRMNGGNMLRGHSDWNHRYPPSWRVYRRLADARRV